MTYTHRQELFAAAWNSIQGDDALSRDERTDLRFSAMDSPELAEVYRDITGYSPESGDIRADVWSVGRKGIRARLHGGSIRGHAGPAHQIFRSILALNDTVVMLVNRQLDRPYAHVTDSVKEKLGLWGLAPQPGSVVVELVSPPADFGERRRATAGPTDSPFPELDAVPTPAEHSIDELFSVLAAVQEYRESPLELEDRLVELGTQATRNLDRFAQRCTELDATVDLDDRTQKGSFVSFQAEDAKYLHKTIKTLRLDEDLKIVEGMWRTASLERRIFDLVLENGEGIAERISGIVPKSLMAASADAFNRYVRIEFREYRRGGNDGTLRRVLENITVLGQTPPTS